MEEQLMKIYEAEIAALRKELELTRDYIYREFSLTKGLEKKTTQDLIDLYIKNRKEEEL